ncbi:MAG TPA: MFS transporter, partial [Solirubrobacteraceae bacterium]|nr:MFS transporter [Solirubrobacteraceae bacterium]
AVNALGKDVVFWIYAGFAALGLVFVRLCVPETKDRSLEDIDSYWTNGHRWPDHDGASRAGADSGSGTRTRPLAHSGHRAT